MTFTLAIRPLNSLSLSLSFVRYPFFADYIRTLEKVRVHKLQWSKPGNASYTSFFRHTSVSRAFTSAEIYLNFPEDRNQGNEVSHKRRSTTYRPVLIFNNTLFIIENALSIPGGKAKKKGSSSTFRPFVSWDSRSLMMHLFFSPTLNYVSSLLLLFSPLLYSIRENGKKKILSSSYRHQHTIFIAGSATPESAAELPVRKTPKLVAFCFSSQVSIFFFYLI